MSQIHIVSVKSLTGKIHRQTALDAHETAKLYERTGFWLIFQIFRYYGFRLQESPRIHSCLSRCHVGLFISITLAAVAVHCYLCSALVWKADGSLNLNNASFFAIIFFAYFLTILYYSVCVANARKYSSFIRSVSSAVHLITNVHKKQKTVLSIRRSSYVCLIFILFGVLTAALPCLYQMQMREENLDNNKQLQLTTSIVLVISSVLTIVWVATIQNFYLFSNCFLLFVCKTLSALIDIYLEPEDREENEIDNSWVEPEEKIDEEMNEKLANHRKLSALVKQANSIFSHLLLISLAMEISLCISFIKVLSIENGMFSSGTYANTFHAMMMVGKAIACANVNDKLKSSLQLNKFPSSKHLFLDQQNYILYQTDQQNNRAEITYGNIIPVTKTFIFTIAGTALTYALVLQEVHV